MPDVIVEDVEEIPDDVPPLSAEIPAERPISLDDEPAESPADRVRRLVAGRNNDSNKDSSSRTSPRPSTAKRKVPMATSMPSSKELQEAITGLYVTLGVAVSMVDPLCGMAIGEHASSIAEAWDSLAQNNPAVAKALKSMTGVSGWGGLLVAHTPFLMMIAAHHSKPNTPAQQQIATVAMQMNPATAAKFGVEQDEPD